MPSIYLLPLEGTIYDLLWISFVLARRDSITAGKKKKIDASHIYHWVKKIETFVKASSGSVDKFVNIMIGWAKHFTYK